MNTRPVLTSLLIIASIATAPQARSSGPAYIYDDAGRLQMVSYPQGNGVLYSYDDVDNVTSVTPVSVPLPPAELNVSLPQPTTAQLQWSPVSGAQGYLIMRRASHNRVWQPISEESGSTTLFVDNTLQADTSYSYQVFALTASGLRSAGSPIASPPSSSRGMIDTWLLLPTNRQSGLQLIFLSEEGALYRVESATTLTTTSWAAQPAATNPVAAPDTFPFAGNGGYLNLYIPHNYSDQHQFYRVVQVD